MLRVSSFFISYSAANRCIHSFPIRRSSDLGTARRVLSEGVPAQRSAVLTRLERAVTHHSSLQPRENRTSLCGNTFGQYPSRGAEIGRASYRERVYTSVGCGVGNKKRRNTQHPTL